MRAARGVTLLLALGLCASAVGSSQPSYGPDSAVDGHPSAWYVEPAIAVSPKDARKLISGSMLFGVGGLTAETFRSDDGGYSWRSTTLPLASGSLLGDVQADFSADGKGYMTVLGSEVASGATLNGLYVFGTLDAGETFERLAFLQTPDKHGYDHEQLAIDRTAGAYRGRIYMSVLYSVRLSPQVNALGMLWSSDGGRTFHGPVEVSRGWSFNSRPVVLPDGSVLFAFIHEKQLTDTRETVSIATSRDGGRSFGPSKLIGDRIVYSLAATTQRLSRGDYAFDADSVPQFAAARTSGGRTEIYGVWSDVRTGPSRLLFTRSDDLGARWTPATAIFTTADRLDSQYQPSVAVNEASVLGITWYDASHAAGTVAEMFAVSHDGGRTFSAPARISSVSSPIRPPNGDGYSAQAFPDPSGIFVGFTSPLSRYPSFGDYMGLATDSRGAFHPIWIDARNGAGQVWTATAFANAPDPQPAGISQCILTNSIALEFGVGTWDGKSHTLSVPVRLHNVSRSVLYPPFTVTVTKTHNPYEEANSAFAHNLPQVAVLNADNGKSGTGATLVYRAGTIGNLGRLLPGADTSSRVWRLRLPNSFDLSLVTSVSGYVMR